MNENNRLLNAFRHDTALQSLHGLFSCPQQKRTSRPNSNGPTGTDTIPSLKCYPKLFFYSPNVCACALGKRLMFYSNTSLPAAFFREAVPQQHIEPVFGGGSVQLGGNLRAALTATVCRQWKKKGSITGSGQNRYWTRKGPNTWSILRMPTKRTEGSQINVAERGEDTRAWGKSESAERQDESLERNMQNWM